MEPGLLELLDLDAHDGDRFVGAPPPEPSSPVYGGHLAAQALAAAGRTVRAELFPHSAHCFFVRPARPGSPFEYHVDRVRDSAAFATRRVRALQDGREVFALTASFHRPEPGLEHQDLMPALPGPDGLAGYEERLSAAFGAPMEPLGKPYELRFAGPLSFEVEKDPALVSSRTAVWVRVRTEALGGELPLGARLLHACLLVYVCDVTMLDTVLVRHGVSWFNAGGWSVDYTVWLHRPFRADDWLLCALETPAASEGRGLVLGQVFTGSGELVASLAQEGLIRVRRRAT